MGRLRGVIDSVHCSINSLLTQPFHKHLLQCMLGSCIGAQPQTPDRELFQHLDWHCFDFAAKHQHLPFHCRYHYHRHYRCQPHWCAPCPNQCTVIFLSSTIRTSIEIIQRRKHNSWHNQRLYTIKRYTKFYVKASIQNIFSFIRIFIQIYITWCLASSSIIVFICLFVLSNKLKAMKSWL